MDASLHTFDIRMRKDNATVNANIWEDVVVIIGCATSRCDNSRSQSMDWIKYPNCSQDNYNSESRQCSTQQVPKELSLTIDYHLQSKRLDKDMKSPFWWINLLKYSHVNFVNEPNSVGIVPVSSLKAKIEKGWDEIWHWKHDKQDRPRYSTYTNLDQSDVSTDPTRLEWSPSAN